MFAMIERRGPPHSLTALEKEGPTDRCDFSLVRNARPEASQHQNRRAGLAPDSEPAGWRLTLGSVETDAGRVTAGGADAERSTEAAALALVLAVVAGAGAADAASADGFAAGAA